MNLIVLMGRLTRDPEVRYTQGEKSMAIARYTLAVDRRNGKQEADFIPCVAFDKAGEFAEKYFRRGMRILVSGRIQTGSYTNRDGQKVYTTDVIVQGQEFADKRKDENGGYQTVSRSEPGNSVDDGFMNIPDGFDEEGLPF